MLGTVPKDKEIYKSYIESKAPEGLNGESETVEEIEEKGWTGFHKDEEGLFVYDYFIKGFIKNAGNILKDNAKIQNLRSKLSNNLFVFPRKVRLGKVEPDGVLERPLRAQTPQGPRVTLARSDYIAAGTEITFQIGWIEHKDLSEKLIMELFAYGELQGLGQFRNGGYGRFTVVSVK
jgi:hypothetical protein